MKVYYLFDGNEIKDILINEEGYEEECVDIFEERSRKRMYTEHSWLGLRIISLDLEGQAGGEGILYTITINNKPVKAVLNPTTEDKANMFMYCLKNTGDYRNCRVNRNIVE